MSFAAGLKLTRRRQFFRIQPATERWSNREENMAEVSLTFRDRLLSVYQSAVADLARQMESDRPPPEAPRDLWPSEVANMVTAAEQAAALRNQGQTDTHSVRPEL